MSRQRKAGALAVACGKCTKSSSPKSTTRSRAPSRKCTSRSENMCISKLGGGGTIIMSDNCNATLKVRDS
eukprot:3143293-Pleurochrysis_carterae.AAC.1